MAYKCPTCKKTSSYKSTCQYCGVVFCNYGGCKGNTGDVKQQNNKLNGAQCQSCKKTRALVREVA